LIFENLYRNRYAVFPIDRESRSNKLFSKTIMLFKITSWSYSGEVFFWRCNDDEVVKRGVLSTLGR